MKRSEIEILRLIVRNLNDCSETFLQRFDAAQLVALGRAQLLSDWDIAPDRWSARQVREALEGKPPQFDAREEPLYT